jgi:hypothetical protein
VTVAGLVIAAILAVGAVLFVARPFLRGDRGGPLPAPDPAEARRLELVEARDRALAALKELEFDHRTGKISDTDYRELVGPLREEAAEALRALDPPAAPPVVDPTPSGEQLTPREPGA